MGIYHTYHTVADAVFAYAGDRADHLAVADVRGTYTYAQLADQVQALSACLRSFGLLPGDHILVECTQDGLFLSVALACQNTGLVFVPFESGAKEERVYDLYAQAEPALMIAAHSYDVPGHRMTVDELITEIEKVKEKCHRTCDHRDSISIGGNPYENGRKVSADDVAEILFSTGTTGEPKGIVISNRANLAIADNIIRGAEMKPDAVELVPFPLSHSHGLRTCYAHLVNGSTVVLTKGILHMAQYFSMAEEYRVDALDLSPTMARALLQVGRKGLMKMSDRITYMIVGTEHLDESTKIRLKETFPHTRIFNFYGSTEAGRSCICDITSETPPGCIGFPTVHAKLMVVDEHRKKMKSDPEHPGRIAVSGDMMMEGYYLSPELTAETLIDGILYTSDLGYIDETGRVFVIGRIDDVINYKGIKIAPSEIERVAEGYEGIMECACTAASDPLCGQVPKLFIVVRDPDTFSMEQYQKYLSESLDVTRRPAKVVIVDHIPKTSNGKKLRRKLRDEDE